MRRSFVLAAPCLVLALAVTPTDLKAEPFGPWNAACDDAGYCQARTGENVGLVLEPGRFGWHVAIEYDGAIADPDRPFNLSLEDGPEIVATPAIDMTPFRDPARFYFVEDALTKRVFGALLSHERARFSYIDITGEAISILFELAQLSAAIDWIDARSGIALPRIGAEADALPAPTVRDERAAIQAAGIPDPVMYLHAGSNCEDLASPGVAGIPPLIEPVSETAILYALPCVVSGENTAYRLYIRERGEIGGVREQLFALWSDEYGWTGADIVHNVTVDGPALTAVFLGRSVTDCGWAGRWLFVDYQFRLERFAVQESCTNRAPSEWPVVYGGE